MNTHILDKTKIWNVYGRIELHVYLNKKEKQGPDFDIIVVPLKLLLDSCPAHPKRALLYQVGVPFSEGLRLAVYNNSKIVSVKTRNKIYSSIFYLSPTSLKNKLSYDK
jgi:hypothetical protein